MNRYRCKLPRKKQNKTKQCSKEWKGSYFPAQHDIWPVSSVRLSFNRVCQKSHEARDSSPSLLRNATFLAFREIMTKRESSYLAE